MKRRLIFTINRNRLITLITNTRCGRLVRLLWLRPISSAVFLPSSSSLDGARWYSAFSEKRTNLNVIFRDENVMKMCTRSLKLNENHSCFKGRLTTSLGLGNLDFLVLKVTTWKTLTDSMLRQSWEEIAVTFIIGSLFDWKTDPADNPNDKR